MKRFFIVGCLTLLLAGATSSLWAQEEDLSANRIWGVGVRFLPSALSPMAPFNADPALSSAISVQYWMNDLLALEAGGWVSSFKDAWSENSTTIVSAGLLVKLANYSRFDLYLAGRAVSLNASYKGGMICPFRSEDSVPSPIPPPPCWPWPSNESRTSTLAFGATGGLEWSVASQVAFDLEFGMIYAQTTTMNLYPTPPPTEPPTPEPPKPLQQLETFASSSLNWVIHTGIYFYF